jgi:Lipase maturation factor
MPTNLAFYSYYLPDGYLKLTTIFVHLSELLCPWLFFAPVRSVRIFAFYWQVFLQICIIATGNYGFINYLILTMLLSLLDDSHFQSNESNEGGINFKKVFSFVLTMATVFFIFIITITFYKISWTDGVVDATIRKFSLIETFESFLTNFVIFQFTDEPST